MASDELTVSKRRALMRPRTFDAEFTEWPIEKQYEALADLRNWKDVKDVKEVKNEDL